MNCPWNYRAILNCMVGTQELAFKVAERLMQDPTGWVRGNGLAQYYTKAPHTLLVNRKQRNNFKMQLRKLDHVLQGDPVKLNLFVDQQYVPHMNMWYPSLGKSVPTIKQRAALKKFFSKYYRVYQTEYSDILYSKRLKLPEGYTLSAHIQQETQCVSSNSLEWCCLWAVPAPEPREFALSTYNATSIHTSALQIRVGIRPLYVEGTRFKIRCEKIENSAVGDYYFDVFLTLFKQILHDRRVVINDIHVTTLEDEVRSLEFSAKDKGLGTLMLCMSGCTSSTIDFSRNPALPESNEGK